jgi:hypothetical protein
MVSMEQMDSFQNLLMMLDLLGEWVFIGQRIAPGVHVIFQLYGHKA